MSMKFVSTLLVKAVLAVALVAAVAVMGALAAESNKTMLKADPLTGYQEATPAGVSTVATGSFEATIDGGAQTIDYTLSYSGRATTALLAHIHFRKRFTSGGLSAFLCGGRRT